MKAKKEKNIKPSATSGGCVHPDVASLQKRVKELEKHLLDAEIRAEFYDEMINVAEGMFSIKIRKKAGVKQ